MKYFVLLSVVSAIAVSHSATAGTVSDYFANQTVPDKRYSVSVGWLHANPTGDANPLQNSTVINDGSSSGVLTDVTGLQSWQSPNTGLEADDVDTAGLIFKYAATDNIKFEIKGGIPPRVDILGKGEVFAPINASLNGEALSNNLPITDLTQGSGVAASARAWLPVVEAQYQFGKSGVDKLRPYVGVGFMYAYFNDFELNDGIRNDLEIAGQRVQQLKANNPFVAIGELAADGSMDVDVDSGSDFAPIITLGATYDLNDKWFAVGSLSYAKLDSDTTIKVIDKQTNETLITAKTKTDIDPFITYLGVGYRF
ncbi:OmpW family protein [uncultured Psychrobacter sp.]|uniref:OmpW/AlkL family protein n=1 Tax=uncultured Psychrobacter sp. TaxID=259303 RepID=UPI0034579223